MLFGHKPPDTNAPLTPVERRGAFFCKRDDLFEIAGVRGGKVRSCFELAKGALGLVSAGSRSSPQANIVAHIAKFLGVPCRVHTPTGTLSPELISAQEAGAEVVQHKAGYNSVIVARAREDAKARGWREIPFGMECMEAVRQTRGQVWNIPPETRGIIVPVGSGMSLAGILWGLKDMGATLPVWGMRVGACPNLRLDKYAPPDWPARVKMFESDLDYHEAYPSPELEGLKLDSVYEAKCIPLLNPDIRSNWLLWVVGIRKTA